MGLLDRFVRRGIRDDRPLMWSVQFEPDGKVYVYRRTTDEFKAEMAERIAHGRELPHRIQVTRDGELVDVRIDLD